MPALTKTDMFEIVTGFNDEFQPCLEKTEYGTCKTPGPCVATPRRMKVVLDELQAYTDEVQSARNQHKALGIASIALGPAGIPITDLLGGGEVNVPQWRRDMANWQFRLAQYQLALAQYTAAHPTELDTPAGCEAIYRKITAPLLDGVFYEIMPGIIYSQDEKEAIARGEGAERTVNDVITPFTLGNQIIVYQDFQKENAIRFFDDVIEAIKKLIKNARRSRWMAVVAQGRHRRWRRRGRRSRWPLRLPVPAQAAQEQPEKPAQVQGACRPTEAL